MATTGAPYSTRIRKEALDTDIPLDLPHDYFHWLNETTGDEELEVIRASMGGRQDIIQAAT